jgi:peptidoglycan/LPS O-acetylase OafA/YrhL
LVPFQAPDLTRPEATKGRPRGEQAGTACPNSKLVCFEAIRGLAALMVVVFHIIVGFWPGLVYKEGPQWDNAPGWARTLVRFPGERFWDGGMAVTIFFVLSGFVLSLTFVQKGPAKALGSAALRRYPRLMLPVAASILLTYLLMKTGAICNRTAADVIHHGQGITYDPASRPGESNHWLLMWYHFAPDLGTAVHQSLWGAFTGIATYNLVLWTMPIELVGSFLVYGFLALFGDSRNRWLLYAICAGVIFVRNDALPVAGSYYLLDFVLGMALCDLWVHNQRTWRKSLSLGPALGLVCVGFFIVAKIKPLAALIIIGATAASPRMQQILSTRWLAFLGRLSFGLYLVHMMVFCSLGCGTYIWLCRDLGWHHMSGSLTAAAATLVATVLASWAFYHLVDRPAIALTHRLDSWLFRRSAEPGAPTAVHRDRAA